MQPVFLKTSMKRILIILPLLLAAALSASAQRFSAGTNAVDWLTLGTVNAEASVAVSQKVSIHAGAELNPWTWRSGDPGQFQTRQNSAWGGARWWPWHVYSGWWVGGDARYSVYNLGGVTSLETEEGDAFGAGAWGGYALMLGRWWNIDLGLGFWGGYTTYTRYACPRCGVRTDEGGKSFILPDARIAFQIIF